MFVFRHDSEYSSVEDLPVNIPCYSDPLEPVLTVVTNEDPALL